MSRVIPALGVVAAALSLALLCDACAPSVPRTPDISAPIDASADTGSEPRADLGSTILDRDAADGNTTPRDGVVKDIASGDAVARDVAAQAEVAGDLAAERPDAARERDVMAADAGADRQGGGGDAGGNSDGDARGADAEVDTPATIDGGAGDATVARAARGGDLKIDELLINPAGTDTSREWIEVANISGDVLDLRLLHVADAAGEVALDAGLLAPGALLVLGQSLDPARNGGAPVGFSFGNTISLNNPGDSIRLCVGPCADGVVLDEVTWTADLGAAFDGHAAIVGGVGQGGTGDGGGITFCPAAEPFGTAGSFGSPGQPNPPCPG